MAKKCTSKESANAKILNMKQTTFKRAEKMLL